MEYADIVIRSTHIFTGSKKEEPFAGAVAVKGNHICRVSQNGLLEELTGPQTKVLDFGDRLVMPGFIDSHMHFFMGAAAASGHMTTEIAASRSEDECIEIMKTFAEEHPDEERILGQGWFWLIGMMHLCLTKKSLIKCFPTSRVIYLMRTVTLSG